MLTVEDGILRKLPAINIKLISCIIYAATTFYHPDSIEIYP